MSADRSKPTPRKTHLLDDGRNVRRLLWVLYAACAATLVADLVIHRGGSEDMFGFYALFSIAACVLLVVLGRQLRRMAMRRDDYYE